MRDSGPRGPQNIWRSMYARLSSNYPELEKACLQQRLPHKKRIVRKQIAALARTLAGLPKTR